MRKLILLAFICSSCVVQRAERVQTLAMNNVLDRYYETVWNAENNMPGERRRARQAVREQLTESTFDTVLYQQAEGALYEQVNDSTWIKVK